MDTMYDIVGRYMSLLDLGDDPDIDEEVWKETLDSIEGEIEEKADNYAKVMQIYSGKAEMLDKEIKRLQAKKSALTKASDRLKKNLENAMKATGKTKFETALFRFNIQKNAPAVVLAEGVKVCDLPPQFVKFSDPEVDKVAIKNVLRTGVELPFARLEQSESLRIK